MSRLKLVMVPLAVVVAAAVALPLVVRAQQPGYKGSKLCVMCHQNTHKEVVESWKKTGHASALWPADQPAPALKRTILGDFKAGPGFDQSQVKWVLGLGLISRQAYLDADFKVLPKWWDVKAKAWAPAMKWDHASQKMAEVGADTDARLACLGCHTTGYDPQAAKYGDAGVACEACHGPGVNHVGKGTKDTIVRPATLEPAREAMLCGQCHAHGADATGKYAFPVGFKPGDDLTKSFTMDPPAQGAMNQQYAQWLTSKHAAAGTVCTFCHEPHGVGGRPNQLKMDMPALCLSCHGATAKNPMKVTDMHKMAAEKGQPSCTMCHMPGGSHAFTVPKV